MIETGPVKTGGNLDGRAAVLLDGGFSLSGFQVSVVAAFLRVPRWSGRHLFREFLRKVVFVMPGENQYHYDPQDPDQLKSKFVFAIVVLAGMAFCRFVLGW